MAAIRTGRSLWARHPAVNNDLTTGERAADALKKKMGTWSMLFAIFAFIATWIGVQFSPARWDGYPYIALNLLLSCVAAVQGVILQISANRGDRISAQVAQHTAGNTDDLMAINRTQLEILHEVRAMRAEGAHPSAADEGSIQQNVRD